MAEKAQVSMSGFLDFCCQLIEKEQLGEQQIVWNQRVMRSLVWRIQGGGESRALRRATTNSCRCRHWYHHRYTLNPSCCCCCCRRYLCRCLCVCCPAAAAAAINLLIVPVQMPLSPLPCCCGACRPSRAPRPRPCRPAPPCCCPLALPCAAGLQPSLLPRRMSSRVTLKHRCW